MTRAPSRDLDEHGTLVRGRWLPRPIPILSASVLLIALSWEDAGATLIVNQAQATDLAGGSIIVSFERFGPTAPTPILDHDPTNTDVQAVQLGLFRFFVEGGDTAKKQWTLVNISNDFILDVRIDLRGSVSLFDDDSHPSTLVSERGREGVQRIAGPVPMASFEFLPWVDPMNLGDMFHGEQILWPGSKAPPGNGQPFGPGQIFTWMDDTDKPATVPAPWTLPLLAFGMIALLRRAR